jgi:hypothetical protein
MKTIFDVCLSLAGLAIFLWMAVYATRKTINPNNEKETES